MTLKHDIRRSLWKVGYDVERFDAATHPLARRRKLMKTYGVDLLLDVGANIGQYAMETRQDLDYAGHIVSFEPLSSAFKALQSNAVTDPLWEVHNFALGAENARAEINIAGNSYSSSLLDMMPAHLHSAPESGYVGRESIEVRTLDSVFPALAARGRNVYLKIDTQGFEPQVLRGAEASLAQIATIQVEMSLVPLYADGLPFVDMVRLLESKGYGLVALEPGFSDAQTGQMLQVDGIFHRA